MGKYKDLQKYVSDYFGDKSKEELQKELFFYHPELFNEIAKYRGYGIPKAYKNATKKYKVDKNIFFFESNLAKQYTGNPRYILISLMYGLIMEIRTSFLEILL